MNFPELGMQLALLAKTVSQAFTDFQEDSGHPVTHTN
jgi:hypothetical protein